MNPGKLKLAYGQSQHFGAVRIVLSFGSVAMAVWSRGLFQRSNDGFHVCFFFHSFQVEGLTLGLFLVMPLPLFLKGFGTGTNS